MALPGYQLPYSSYEPHPSIPGAYNFTPTGGGSPYMFAGPGAQQMAGMIDQMPPPQEQASNAAANMPAGDISGAIQGFAQQPSQAPSASDMTHATPQAAPDPRDLNANIPAPEVASQTADQAGTQAAGLPQRNYSQPAASGAPQAAPSQMAANPRDYVIKTTSKAGYTPTSEKVVTEGGVQDPAMRQAMTTAYVDKMKADNAEAEAVKMQQASLLAQSQIQAAQAAKEADALEKQKITREAAQVEAANEYGRIMQVKQDELQNASGREVDQFRMYRGKPGAQIGAAIAGALGAFGSAFTHGPNFALDIINRQIDNDVQSQREEINRGVSAKQNDIGRIKDKYNVDNTVAEKLLGISLTERAQALARKQAALQGGAEAQARLIAVDGQLAQKRIDYLNQINEHLNGKAQITAEQKYHAGGTSYGVAPELKATAQAATLMGQTGQGLGTAEEGSYKATHGGSAPPKAGGGEGKESPRIAMKRAVNESALEDLPTLEKADKGGVFVPGLPDALKSEERKDIEANAAAMVSKLTDAAGDPLTETVRHDIYSRLVHPTSPEVRAKTREALKTGTMTYGRALERASERSRGQAGSLEEAADR